MLSSTISLPRSPLSLRRSLAAALCLLSSAVPALADSLSCSSVNGYTLCTNQGGISCQAVNGAVTCRGADGLSCRAADGRLACTHGPATTCETTGRRTVCRSSTATQGLQAAPSPGSDPEDRDDEDDDALPAGRR
jgi:hypothetical protein